MSLATPQAGARLTARELQVLAHVANGHDAEETGARLRLSSYTIKSHLQRIYRKLGARDAAHAVGLAIATRQLPPRVVAVIHEPTTR